MSTKVPGSGELTVRQRELTVRALMLAGIEPGTLMLKVLRPGAAECYLRDEVFAGTTDQPPFSFRLVGGSVSRQQDTAHRNTVSDFVRGFRLDYPESPFGVDPVSVQTMEFVAVDIDRFVLPLGAPSLPYPEFGYPPNQSQVRSVAGRMIKAARRVGLDPDLVREELNPWPFTGTGIIADAELGFPEYWMLFSQVPVAATIFDHGHGQKTPIGVYRGAVLGWESLR